MNFRVFLQTMGAIFSNQTRLGVIFAGIFRNFVQFLRDFSHTIKDSARIFGKSKLLVVRLKSMHPHPYTTGCIYTLLHAVPHTFGTEWRSAAHFKVQHASFTETRNSLSFPFEQMHHLVIS